MTQEFTPPYTTLANRERALRERGYVLLDGAAVRQWLATDVQSLDALHEAWSRLPSDRYLRDGGEYRYRRHSCYVVSADRVDPVPHRPHWQSLEYNALHGGMQRWFEPVEPASAALPVWERLLLCVGEAASLLHGAQPWYVEAHPFRIDTGGGIGRPTP